MPITIHAVTAANWRETLLLGVQPEQQHFVAHYTPIAMLILAKAYVQAANLTWLPFAFYVEDAPIGMIALAYDPASPTYILYHFFIDHAQQGKGYGKQALRSFIDYVRATYPACQRLELTVHPENPVAQRLYQSAGFVDTGEIRDGEPVYQLRFSE